MKLLSSGHATSWPPAKWQEHTQASIMLQLNGTWASVWEGVLTESPLTHPPAIKPNMDIESPSGNLTGQDLATLITPCSFHPLGGLSDPGAHRGGQAEDSGFSLIHYLPHAGVYTQRRGTHQSRTIS